MSGIVWVEEPNENSFLGKTKKRKLGKRKIEFVGWGSRPLIEFLDAIGKDPTTKLTQNEVAALIIKYINDNNLFCKVKKKKFQSDDRLYAIFGKKSMFRTKIYEMLEEHFAENHDESEDDFTGSSDEENCQEKKRNVKLRTIPLQPKSCFAAVVPDNIKLVYLKKSLVQEFLKVPETFDSKIVGSFVRMRSDPFDIYQKNRFQLQLVTGVKDVSEASSAGTEVCLKVANFFKDIPISALSDENFTDEEIEDVRDRIKSGALQRLTVVELESKAQMLHTDITKHSIARELILLKRRIDRANEKGWRRELGEYLGRRKLLQTPSEVEILLHKIPEVIAEELEPDASAMIAMASENTEGNDCSPTSILRGTSDVSSTDASGFGDLATPSQVVADDLPTPRRGNVEMDNGVILTENPCGQDDANEISIADWFKRPTHTSEQVQDIGIGDLATPSEVFIDFSVGIPAGQTGDTILTRNNPRGHDGANEISIADWFKPPTHTSEEVQDIGFGDLATPSEVLTDFSVGIPIGQTGDTILTRNNHRGEDEANEISIADWFKSPTHTSEQVQEIDDQPPNPGQEATSVIDSVRILSRREIQVPSTVGKSLQQVQVTSSRENARKERSQQSMAATAVVINLSDDDSDERNTNPQIGVECPDSSIWYYFDRQGITQGPFSLSTLNRWRHYFGKNFIVWKHGQSPNDAVLLADILRRI